MDNVSHDNDWTIVNYPYNPADSGPEDSKPTAPRDQDDVTDHPLKLHRSEPCTPLLHPDEPSPSTPLLHASEPTTPLYPEKPLPKPPPLTRSSSQQPSSHPLPPFRRSLTTQETMAPPSASPPLFSRSNSSRPRRTINRISTNTQRFLGLGGGEDNLSEQAKWAQRREKLRLRRFGPLKTTIDETSSRGAAVSQLDSLDGVSPLSVPATAPAQFASRPFTLSSPMARPSITPTMFSRQTSQYSTSSATGAGARRNWRRVSAARMAVSGFQTLLRQPSRPPSVPVPAPIPTDRSFPADILEHECYSSTFFHEGFFSSDFDAGPPSRETPFSADDSIFFDFAPSTTSRFVPSSPPPWQRRKSFPLPTLTEEVPTPQSEEADVVDAGFPREPLEGALYSPGRWGSGGGDAPSLAGELLDRTTTAESLAALPVHPGWGRKERKSFPLLPGPTPAVSENRLARIPDQLVESFFDNSDRRMFGLGIVGQLLNRQFKEDVGSALVNKLDTMDDHRPYFTYWITFIHVLVIIVALSVHGMAPVGFSGAERSDTVLKTNLAREILGYMTPTNFWIGPRPADLIRLGAKYSPCMRPDNQIANSTAARRSKENGTACCVRNDGSGCVQSPPELCSPTLSTFVTFAKVGVADRARGTVCGQDPRRCRFPLSAAPSEWPDDLSRWPICTIPENDTADPGLILHHSVDPYINMHCDVLGRPCCYGIKAECGIMTSEECLFYRGFFHENAFLCSQVDCLTNTCGLLGFRIEHKPDQVYRLFISLFLHAGVIHCFISVVFQMTILRDMEKLTGCLRIAIIYLLSGISGNLLSAILLPFEPQVGPSGSMMGILACLIVEVVQSWPVLLHPWFALLKLLCILGFFLVLGLIPWLDNFAQLGGFISGIFLAFMFLPYVTIGSWNATRKLIAIIVSGFGYLGFMAMCIVVFFVIDISTCDWCSKYLKYINCIDFTDKFCENLSMDIDESTTLVVT